MSMRRQTTQLFFVLAMVMLALLAIAARNGGVTAAAEGTTVILEVPSGAAVGDLIEVPLVVNNARDLAGFQATIHYDPAQLRLTGARLPEHLGNSGRGLLALGPVFREDSVVIGAASCPVADCNDLPRERLQRLPEGVEGRVTIATLSFYVEQAGAYTLRLEGVKLVNPEGASLPQASLDAVLEVSGR
jgi:hypothetical protein